MNTQTKTLIAVLAVLTVLYFVYRRTDYDTAPINGEEDIDMQGEEISNEIENFNGQLANEQGRDLPATVKDSNDMVKYFPQRDYAPPESEWLSRKFNSRNKGDRGEYKQSSYAGALRGNLGSDDWKDYFEHNNNLVGNSQSGDNDKFMPIDETNGSYAVFKSKGRATCGSNQNCEPEDLFDVDKYLPQEVNDDWFETVQEPISVKNRHLINITKPIGVNTIGSSLKNASYDIRGRPANPKAVISPWMNSSIEPDVSLKPLY